MGIKKSGNEWRGDSAAHIDQYLGAFTAEAYPVSSVVHAACARCGADVFGVRLDDDCAERTCAACGHTVLMLDSADYVEDAELDSAQCPCGHEQFNVAVGFATLPSGQIRWVYLGLRCTADGALGCYADWKIDYAPSTHLLTQV